MFFNLGLWEKIAWLNVRIADKSTKCLLEATPSKDWQQYLLWSFCCCWLG
jgi:hypothetical protein